MRHGRALTGSVAGMGAAVGAWSLFESQWVEFNEIEVPLERLPRDLDAFHILHLSDFHLGTVSFNARTLRKATEWGRSLGQTRGPARNGAGRTIDLVAITGDLLSRRRGRRELAAALGRLEARHGVFAVLGNHDVAETRDPFVDTTGLQRIPHGTLLADEARTIVVRGRRVQIVGVDPQSFAERHARPADLADPEADLRILLCHFPDVIRRLPPGVFDLVLAGHLHGGQIAVPTAWGKLHLEHLRAAYWEGFHRTPAGPLYVSRGLGTSFVPFRLFARPEVALLTLRAP